jgi:outer membrane lipase/esterase
MDSKMERWRGALVGAGVLASALLASCGGGQQVTAFSPNRIVAFGDEASVIDDFKGDANGRKYSVNGTVSATDATLDCKQNPIWIQILATQYGLVFPQCNPAPNAVAAPTSRIRAFPGAVVADLSGQIDAQLAESPFTGRDFAVVMIGQNDVLAAYAQYPTVSESTLTLKLQAAGTAYGDQVNRLSAAGAKVLVASMSDVGLSPFAYAERAAHADTDRAALLRRLTKALNDKMRSRIVNDGHLIGLILLDEYIGTVAATPGAGGFVNATTAVCIPPSALDCTNLTLISGGGPTAYLWADATHLSYGGQAALGSLVVNRAVNNPF